ncbi:hypothetical protein BLOT_004035 [Blomia tropicalis]|nr:hypothetical protein BLOT_004035 [Blomia tropicalis]
MNQQCTRVLNLLLIIPWQQMRIDISNYSIKQLIITLMKSIVMFELEGHKLGVDLMFKFFICLKFEVFSVESLE